MYQQCDKVPGRVRAAGGCRKTEETEGSSHRGLGYSAHIVLTVFSAPHSRAILKKRIQVYSDEGDKNGHRLRNAIMGGKTE